MHLKPSMGNNSESMKYKVTLRSIPTGFFLHNYILVLRSDLPQKGDLFTNY